MEQIFSSALLGSAMPLTLTWSDLAWRLACTLIAGKRHWSGRAGDSFVMNVLMMRLPDGGRT